LIRDGLIKDSLTEADFHAIQNLLERTNGTGKTGLWTGGNGKNIFLFYYGNGAKAGVYTLRNGAYWAYSEK
jgi:hypothetical protein